MTREVVCDTEVYENYFLASFMNSETGNFREFEMYDGQEFDRMTVEKILRTYRVVTFNGNNFDLPILTRAINGANCAELKWLANKIIENNLRAWQIDMDIIRCNHIDLIEVAPGMASLKIYGGRLHAPKMQDLPIEPYALITPEQRPLLRTYCRNDLGTTKLLRDHLAPQIALRERMTEEYGLDLRSKSDAQVAESVIRRKVEGLVGRKLDPVGSQVGNSFRYTPPTFVKFQSPAFQEALDVVLRSTFTVNGKGVVEMPEEIAKLSIACGTGVYRMGIGGLHSSEKSVSYESCNEYELHDKDVASYYPAIILNCGLQPKQMGANFTSVYRGIVNQRLGAKKAGDKVTADSLKITINGSFGKFGSPYSRLYSPTLLIQTTVTGQLALLMLIEMLELAGIPVVSANTDGIVIRCPREKLEEMDEIAMTWEIVTKFDTEDTTYRAIYSRDVNNYIAIKPDGKAKLKGAYAEAGLQKNPTNEICNDAVVAHLTEGADIDHFIRNCIDIRKFVTVRTVNGGAICNVGYKTVDDWVQIADRTWARQKWIDERIDYFKGAVSRVSRPKPVQDMVGGEYLGKAIRWYYAKGVTGALHYKSNGNTVPRSEGAKPLMELPETFPQDVDYDWYANEARSILKAIGYDA